MKTTGCHYSQEKDKKTVLIYFISLVIDGE